LKLWQKITLAVLIGLIGLGLRLDAASKLTIDADEDTYLNNALHYAQSVRTGDWKQIYKYDNNSQHPILAKLVYAATLLTVSPAEELKPKDMIRKIPAAQTEGALWILAARRTAADWGGLAVFVLAFINPLAGLFLAFNSSNIRFTSEVYLEAVPALTSLLVMVTYDQWRRREFGVNKKKNRWLWLAASAVLLGMTGAGKYIYCLVGLAVLVDFSIRLFQDKQFVRPRVLAMLAWGLTGVVMFFVFDPFLWIHTNERLTSSIIFHFNYAQNDYVVKKAARAWWYPAYLFFQTATDAIPWNAGVFYIEPDPWISFIALFGLPLIWIKQRPYAIWLGISIVFLLLWGSKWDQYIMIAIPTVCLSASLAIEWATKWAWTRLKGLRSPRTA
jgi:hypothetical protein